MQISIYISISFFVASIICAILAKKFSKKQINPLYILIAGTFLSIFSIMLYVDHQPKTHGGGATFFLSLFHSIQVMILGYDFEFLHKAFDIQNSFSSFAYFHASLLFFIAPVYTFGFVLSFFSAVTSNIKYLLGWNADIYVISDVTEKSQVLAKSIEEKFPSALVVFTNSSTKGASASKALHFNVPITEFNLKLHSKNTKVTFFITGENEATNLESALSIIGKYNYRQNSKLYVFSSSKEGGLLLDSANIGNIKVRRINENKTVAYSMVHKYDITENATKKDGKNIISALIVGFGGYGLELTKALLWCGQLPNYELKINVIDKLDSESRFAALCPEIIKLNRNTIPGEAHYDLNFFKVQDVNSVEFNNIIYNLTDTSIVYVSLGNDDLNIETAINLRVLFNRIGISPIIRAIVYSDIKYNMLDGDKLGYNIEIVGNISSRYSYDALVDEQLEELAYASHMQWADTEKKKIDAELKFHSSEYHRNSSTASAIHHKYRRNFKLPEDSADDKIFEHMRWNAYMRTEGYVYSGSPDEKTRNDSAKMHHDLRDYDSLSRDEKQKDANIINIQ